MNFNLCWEKVFIGILSLEIGLFHIESDSVPLVDCSLHFCLEVGFEEPVFEMNESVSLEFPVFDVGVGHSNAH